MSYETLDIQERGPVTWCTLNRSESLNVLSRKLVDALHDAGSIESVVAMEDRNQILCAQTKNFGEGVRAFIEKRDPVFGDG